MSFGGGSGSSSIAGSTDVVINSPANNQVLGYNTSLAKWQNQTPGTSSSDFMNVLSVGVVGNGTTDDTAAINAAITANPGKVLLFPSGKTYRIITGQGGDNDHSGGIKLNQAGTTLWCYGATFVMDTSTFQHYQMVDVTAADCAVYGGKFVGDVVAHTGTAGEWGYGIAIGAGADRFKAQDVYAKYCWGDGFFIWERPSDVSLTNCIADNNRRQGLSIIDAIRPRVVGGAYINTGVAKYTGPAGGIDIEPDPGSPRDVIDAIISGVLLAGNLGPGLRTSSNTRTVTATITGCRAVGNGNSAEAAFDTVGANNLTTFTACEAINNTKYGFLVASDVTGTKLNGCTVQLNAHYGIIDNGTDTVITGCVVENNAGSGMFLGGASTTMSGVMFKGNCSTGAAGNVQVDIYGTNATLAGVTSLAGTNVTKPNYGFAVRSGATGARLLGCDATGAFASGPFIDQTAGTTAVTLPKPGTARAGAISTPTSDTVGTKAAIDAIRAALIANGITL